MLEINHVTKEGRSNSDSNVALNWLDTVYSLPWNEPYSKDFSLVIAKDIIEKSHYGMDDVKKRIIEFLAVRKKNNRNEGAIICLVGPPGVGKSSIAKSIAEALGKKFTRFSIGSLHDETDIVGHRRTYVGSRPGKLIQCLRTVHSRDPVILLDEIDKAPSNASLSALLEVLDSEQNKEFHDVYLDFPFDLSAVFIAAAGHDVDDANCDVFAKSPGILSVCAFRFCIAGKASRIFVLRRTAQNDKRAETRPCKRGAESSPPTRKLQFACSVKHPHKPQFVILRERQMPISAI